MPNQTLSLLQSQRLQMILSPQLRQSLEMLQVPIMELRSMIQQEIEQNPTIEELPLKQETVEIEPGAEKNESQENDADLKFDKEFEALAKLDDEWRDYFFQDYHQTMPYTIEDAEKRQFLLDSVQQKESLQEHLMNQLNLAGMPENDVKIGELIIGNINNDGYLTVSIEELVASSDCDIAQVEIVMNIIRDFHPVGVAARDLRECLLIQLEHLGEDDTLAADIVRDHLDKLGAKKYHDIARILKVTTDEVLFAADLISALNPKPGSIYSSEVATYIMSEVVVQKVEGQYVVILNDDQLPHIRISNHYRALLKDKNAKPEVKAYIREKIKSGIFLIKGIEQRQRTIYRIASEIVKVQTEFLDHGISNLKPMTMAEVAKTVGVHETTVSRAVSGKYMKTPSGIFEIKYFFTPGIKTANGQEISNKTVKDIIANMVAKEDPSSPLSDQQIVEYLKKEGITIARRTVAKYRTILHIPPSHMRKLYT